MSDPIKSQALISRGPFSEGKWAIEDIVLRDIRDDEVVVEMVASGICHTDLHCGDTPADKGVPGVYYPRVLGHEGAGYIVKTGSAISGFEKGDPVLLSFSSCGACHVCDAGKPSHCIDFFNINFIGEPIATSASNTNEEIGGRFFGQSSFARHAIVSGKSIVNVKSLDLSRDDLKLLAPLGCGLQTGSGTVIKVAQAGPKDAIAIVGMGGVGLAAVIAARNQGCKTIIGIDRLPARLDLAKSLGATHVFNTTGMSADFSELVEGVKAAADGLGTTISIDTSAFPPLVQAQVDYSRYMGKIIQVGTGMPEAYLKIHMQSFMVSAKQYFGAVQGHSIPQDFVPQIVGWWKEGKFEVEKLVKFFDIKDFKSAVKVMGNGDVVKPILVW